jgi:hypothetical protein|tara:strand:- start:768 stop:962 length:195 start_codon:yes stop_codon:yes gene_type:complete
MERKKLDVGEKYLKCVITVGNVDFEFASFPNYEATKENKQPNFKGRNIAVWVNTKKEEKDGSAI